MGRRKALLVFLLVGAAAVDALAQARMITTTGVSFVRRVTGTLTVENIVVTGTCTGCGATPGGATTEVQFNDGGALGGDADFTWDKVNDALVIGSGIVTFRKAMSGASASNNFLNVTGTLPSTLTAVTRGVAVEITPSGSSSQQLRALDAVLNAGYTGSSLTFAGRYSNATLSTAASAFVGTANHGIQGVASGAGTGHNLGVRGTATGSSGLNLGLIGHAIAATNSPALNVGAGGMALNATVNVAGFFGLMSTAPTLGSSAALIADNGAVAADIFQARDNGTVKVSIQNGGHVAFTGVAWSPDAPTISSGFGTSPSVATNNGTAAFTVNVGTGGTATGGVVGMPTATTGWICHVENRTAVAANRGDQRTVQTATTATSVTVQNQTVSTGAALAFTASDIVTLSCAGY